MRKLVFSLVAIFLLSAVASAITPPAIGFKNWGSSDQQLGKYSFDDYGNAYKLCAKAATGGTGNTMVGGAAFYVAATNGYTVTLEAAAASIADQLAGIVVCTASGATSNASIAAATKVWVQVQGYYPTALMSMEGTASPALAVLKGVSAKTHLTVLRANGAGAATGEGGKKIVLLEAVTSPTGSVTTAKVFIRGIY